MAGMTVLDFSDREVLFKLADTLNEEGVATTYEMAHSMGLDQEQARHVAIRLAWMARFGVVKKQGTRSGETLWTLTPAGRSMLDGKLSGGARDLIGALSDAQKVTVMEALAGRAKQNRLWGTMLRRQWQNRTGRSF